MHLNRKPDRTFDWEEFLEKKDRRRKKTIVILAVLLPGILFLSFYLFQNRHYLIFSLILLGCLAAAFVINFERRRPRAREIVLLASMTSLTVGANEICAHTVPVHAGTTLVVLSGIGLGPEAGFLIGALSRFLCNFFDGQGPWTPWQMFAWGLIGYLAGLFFNRTEKYPLEKHPVEKPSLEKHPVEKRSLAKRLSLEKDNTFRAVAGPVICILSFLIVGYIVFLLTRGDGESFFGWRVYAWGLAGMVAGGFIQRQRLPADTLTVTLYTFFSSLLLYGGIMNFSAMLMGTSPSGGAQAVSFDAMKTLYLTGLPYDAAHAGGAALCAFVFGDAILQRIQRIQIKFGILL